MPTTNTQLAQSNTQTSTTQITQSQPTNTKPFNESHPIAWALILLIAGGLVQAFFRFLFDLKMETIKKKNKSTELTIEEKIRLAQFEVEMIPDISIVQKPEYASTNVFLVNEGKHTAKKIVLLTMLFDKAYTEHILMFPPKTEIRYNLLTYMDDVMEKLPIEERVAMANKKEHIITFILELEYDVLDRTGYKTKTSTLKLIKSHNNQWICEPYQPEARIK